MSSATAENLKIAKEAEEELNQGGREIGVRFEGLTEDEQYLKFRVVDERREIPQTDLAKAVFKMLFESTSPAVKRLIDATKGIVLG